METKKELWILDLHLSGGQTHNSKYGYPHVHHIKWCQCCVDHLYCAAHKLAKKKRKSIKVGISYKIELGWLFRNMIGNMKRFRFNNPFASVSIIMHNLSARIYPNHWLSVELLTNERAVSGHSNCCICLLVCSKSEGLEDTDTQMESTEIIIQELFESSLICCVAIVKDFLKINKYMWTHSTSHSVWHLFIQLHLSPLY